MVLTLNDEKKSTVGYVVPSVDLFYRNVSDYITEYNDAHPDQKMTQDIIRPAETNWLLSFLPTLILFGGLIVFWAVSYTHLDVYKRQALGRGGDQVAVKQKGDTYEFFGGLSKGVEKRDKVRTRVIAATLSDHIKSCLLYTSRCV